MLGEVGDDENENEDYSGCEGDGAEIVEECRSQLEPSDALLYRKLRRQESLCFRVQETLCILSWFPM